MRPRQRQAVRQRFGFRCGYCGVHEHQVGAELTVDHFQPRSCGGTDEPANLIYCCPACNSHKGDYWQPGTAQRILHPLRDNMAQHVEALDDGTLHGLTTTGTFHITRLRLNRPALVALRRRQRRLEAARAAQQELLARIGEVEAQVVALRNDIEALRPESPSDAD